MLIQAALLIIALAALIAALAYAQQTAQNAAQTPQIQEKQPVMPNSADERERAKNAHYMANLMSYDGEEQLDYNG